MLFSDFVLSICEAGINLSLKEATHLKLYFMQQKS